MRIHADVAVVGAGIIGLGAAYAAVRRGQRVVVIDRAEQPHGASIRNFGHLCFGAQTGTAREFANTSRGLWRRFAKDAELWLREGGTSIVARHDDELALLAAAASEGDIELWDQAQTEHHLPIARGVAVGGARVQGDFQVDPRTALASIRRYLESQGVEFLSRTAVGAVTSGVVMTSRGRVTSGRIVVAVGHDIDALLPEVAATHSVKRCTLDMLSARLSDVTLDAPLLTGWSLIRYGRFAGLPAAAAVRERLHTERPDLAALDLNQMYTQRPDGSVIIGDTHTRAADAWPFQTEHAFDALLAEATALFGTTPHVLQRWQGVYASGRDDFLAEAPVPGVLALAATTGIGMTCGLGLAETHVAALLGDTKKEDN